MSRNAPTILALLLIVATATAFAVTQRLKLEPSPISQTRVSDVFSPVCRCATKAANIDFSLRRADHLRIAIRTGSGELTVAEGSFPQGDVHVRWDGRDASGEIVPDGIYYPLVQLQRAGRTIDLPNPIRVDTIRPSIRLRSVRPRVFRPGTTKVTVTYTVSEHAHALLFVDGRRRVLTASKRLRYLLHWSGKVQGRAIRPGRHKLKLVAEDLAGNRSLPTPVVVVRVRRP
ncbi:MAG TPA: FlgD immunoglobulin-like domain containing protein [Gaiellaceae bacterium]|nr:FlgD immunoglobulin-like domain containing protein [Gaiellaceae bacterium]